MEDQTHKAHRPVRAKKQNHSGANEKVMDCGCYIYEPAYPSCRPLLQNQADAPNVKVAEMLNVNRPDCMSHSWIAHRMISLPL